MDEDNQVIDAQIEQDSPNDTSNTATVMLSLEELIKNHLASLDKLTGELKQQQEMINNVLTNDEVYRLQDEAVKEATKVRNTTRSEIMKRPDMVKIDAKVKELRSDMKDSRATLSELLQEYQRTSGNNEIEVDGTLLQIVSASKLIKRS